MLILYEDREAGLCAVGLVAHKYIDWLPQVIYWRSLAVDAENIIVKVDPRIRRVAGVCPRLI